jgi:hypothetical protein
MKTMEYLTADRANKAAIETNPRACLQDETERIKDERKIDLFTRAFLRVRERLARSSRQ